MFITFEGGEGSGKSVQSRRLYRRFQSEGLPVLLTREPGGTRLGEAVTRWLKWHTETRLSPVAELLLFNASRAHLISEVIKPALAQGTIVICDRFADSTIAYQGYGRGLATEVIAEMSRLATDGLKPDLTFLLDVTPKLGLERKSKTQADRFEQEEAAFHDRVRQGYLALAHAEPTRWYILDGSRPRRKLTELIWEKVNHYLSCHRGS
ncbi:MAG: dTMP kinase [Dehalococcoidia bacterium]|nr:dTMP kinase [Dehalococcoidia bacterium]